MNTSKIVWVLALFFSASFASGQEASSAPAGKAVITGVWQGDRNNLPAVTIVVSDEGNALSGAAVFFEWRRNTVSEPFTAKPGLPEPMLNLKSEGKTLQFLISHRRAHPPRTLSDPPSRFHLTVTGPDKAELVNDSENQGPPLVMVRRDY